MKGPRPCPPHQAVARAKLFLGDGGQYVLGTGDYHPSIAGDVPWTERDGRLGSDCAGFAICWCYCLPRHRPGFNVGSWASVSDDLNCNSLLEDAHHAGELAEVISRPELGALLVYPTFSLPGHVGQWIGHVGIVIGLMGTMTWDPAHPDYTRLDVAQCCGPQFRRPAVIATTGRLWADHDKKWPKPEHRTWMLRMKP